MFTYKATTGTCQDCTVWYNLEFKKGLKVKDLVDFVLKEKEYNLWTMQISTKDSVFGDGKEKVEYDKYKAEFLKTFTKKTMNKVIKSVKANGGYGQMGFYIMLEELKAE